MKRPMIIVALVYGTAFLALECFLVGLEAGKRMYGNHGFHWPDPPGRPLGD